MTLKETKLAVKVEEKLFEGLRMRKTLFANFENLGFWQTGSIREGNEEHFFFNHVSGVITLDVMFVDRILQSIDIM